MNFYDDLFDNTKFCQKLGQLTFISSKLEVTLKRLILTSGVSSNLNMATLGQLISIFKSKQIIDDESIFEVLNYIKLRRNYLTHSLFSLFDEDVEATLLPKDNLEPEDAEYYFSECVNDLIGNIQFVIDLYSNQ